MGLLDVIQGLMTFYIHVTYECSFEALAHKGCSDNSRLASVGGLHCWPQHLHRCLLCRERGDWWDAGSYVGSLWAQGCVAAVASRVRIGMFLRVHLLWWCCWSLLIGLCFSGETGSYDYGGEGSLGGSEPFGVGTSPGGGCLDNANGIDDTWSEV